MTYLYIHSFNYCLYFHPLSGFWDSKALHAVVELGVADAIHNHVHALKASAFWKMLAVSYRVRGQGGRASAEEIAAVVPDVDPRALFRVLRFVAGLGVLDMHYTGSDDVRRKRMTSAHTAHAAH
jgi:hypothetical protein